MKNKMLTLLVCSALTLSGVVHAQNNSIDQDLAGSIDLSTIDLSTIDLSTIDLRTPMPSNQMSENTAIYPGMKILNSQTQEVYSVTGNLIVLAEKEEMLRQISRDFNLSLTKYTRGSRLGVFKANEGTDLTRLTAQLEADEKVRQVKIETTEKRFLAH